MTPTTENVVYRSHRLNLRIEAKGAPSELSSPAAATHPGVKMVEFRDGVYQTNDPEIIAYLDNRPDICWRIDEPGSDLKTQFGPEEYERLKKQFQAVVD